MIQITWGEDDSIGKAMLREALHMVSKQEVGYQNEPRGGQQCGGCSMFRGPNACTYVQGVIRPDGWCRAWADRNDGQSAPPD